MDLQHLGVQQQHQQQPFVMASSTTAAAATTTYPFTYTTFSNPSPAPFTKPSTIPSIFSFGSALNCASNSIAPSASAQPSNAPIDRPLGLEGACVISNAAEVNDHAFWDLYACCKGLDITAFGSPGTCTAQCRAEDGQTWQELGECLSKRVEIVVCKPQFSEIGRNNTQQSSVSGAQSSPTRAASGASSGVLQASTGGASSLDAAHATFSKAGLVVFGILALGSAAGMFL